MSELINGDIINEYRNRLDKWNPHDWVDDSDLANNKIIVKTTHFAELRSRINMYASKHVTASDAGCAGGCAGLCVGCASQCTGTCSGVCEGTCSGSCRGRCVGGCAGCSDRWW